jgi:hypothetical protein
MFQISLDAPFFAYGPDDIGHDKLPAECPISVFGGCVVAWGASSSIDSSSAHSFVIGSDGGIDIVVDCVRLVFVEPGLPLVDHPVGRFRQAAAGCRGKATQAWEAADGRRPVHPGTASQAFHHLVATLELPVPDGVSLPRLHDLRHSFAVVCLLRWYQDGLDPSVRLCQLSTFMGHVEPRSTSVYLTMTPQLLAEASRRFEAFAAPAWTQAAQ